MSQLSVAIIGAGIGGLTLGRCLRQKGVHAVIYDRSSTASRHGYGITLESWAYCPLLDVIGMDEHTFKGRVAVDIPNYGGTGRPVRGSPAASNDSTSSFRATRSKLEDLLREDLNIKFDHTVSSSNITHENGGAEVAFTNETKIKPTLLVDTSGVHSKIRASLLPNVTMDVLPYAVFNGKRSISPDHFDKEFASSFDDGNFLCYTPMSDSEPRLEISVNGHRPNGDVSISYVYSRPTRNEKTTDPLHNPDRPITGATDIPKELYEEVDTFVKDRNLEQPYREVFDVDRLRDERLLHWLMRKILVPEGEMCRLLKSGVLIIGDAAHAMPILGGNGANVVISDAVQLSEVIAKTGAEQGSLLDFVHHRWPAWRSAVDQSVATIAQYHAPNKASL